MNDIQLIRVGSDPEVFLQNEETGEVISAIPYIKGTKHKPFLFDKDDKFASIQKDNVLAEFTIAPAETVGDFIKAMHKSMDYINSILPEGIKVLVTPSANLDPKYLRSRQAREFGCSVDFNAYSMQANDPPFAEDPTLRSAGSHIHTQIEGILLPFDGNLGAYPVYKDTQRCEAVKVMDAFVGLPLNLVEPDNKRKELYGKAGAFRPKIYGLEYRTPSNWLLTSDDLMAKVYENTQAAFKYIRENGFFDKNLSDEIRRAIDNNDDKLGIQILNHIGIKTF